MAVNLQKMCSQKAMLSYQLLGVFKASPLFYEFATTKICRQNCKQSSAKYMDGRQTSSAPETSDVEANDNKQSCLAEACCWSMAAFKAADNRLCSFSLALLMGPSSCCTNGRSCVNHYFSALKTTNMPLNSLQSRSSSKGMPWTTGCEGRAEWLKQLVRS